MGIGEDADDDIEVDLPELEKEAKIHGPAAATANIPDNVIDNTAAEIPADSPANTSSNTTQNTLRMNSPTMFYEELVVHVSKERNNYLTFVTWQRCFTREKKCN